jgi:hypothetical protein
MFRVMLSTMPKVKQFKYMEARVRIGSSDLETEENISERTMAMKLSLCLTN